MTLPSERTRAVLQTEKFLLSLCDAKKTPRLPKSIRDNARHLLRHYPNMFDLEVVNSYWNSEHTDMIRCPFGSPFKNETL